MTDNSSAVSIALNDLRFSYGETRVLADVSMLIQSGQVTYLLGPSGAGKTTLGLIIAGGLESEAGSIVKQPDIMPRLVLQFPEQLFLTDSVGEEWQILCNHVSREQAAQAMQVFGLSLSELSNRTPRSLSFGQRRLLALALQSAHDSPFLILDEPTLGLDEDNLARVIAWVKDLRSKDKLCLIITHDTMLIERCPGRGLILSEGVLKWSGNTTEFLERPDLQVAAGFA